MGPLDSRATMTSASPMISVEEVALEPEPELGGVHFDKYVVGMVRKEDCTLLRSAK